MSFFPVRFSDFGNPRLIPSESARCTISRSHDELHRHLWLEIPIVQSSLRVESGIAGERLGEKGKDSKRSTIVDGVAVLIIGASLECEVLQKGYMAAGDLKAGRNLQVCLYKLNKQRERERKGRGKSIGYTKVDESSSHITYTYEIYSFPLAQSMLGAYRVD